jgi:hypothetical protein
MGYVVLPDGAEDVALPLLEDPDDLLDPTRFITGDPARWHAQPLPAGVGWIHPWMFPRALLLDVSADAWFPAPEDETLREVRDAVLPRGYRGLLDALQSTDGPHEDFAQESSLGMRFDHLAPGTPVSLRGVHPDLPSLDFVVAARPAVAWRFDGEVTATEPRLHHLVVEPDALRVRETWAAHLTLPRMVLPGVHAHIPLALRVDDRWCPYDAPPTAFAALREAGLDPVAFARQG